jgi:plasmid rolling circle replication initiator protein Rep
VANFKISPTSDRYLLVTLAVKDCAVQDLRETLLWMSRSFAKMTKLKTWPGNGYIRRTEIVETVGSQKFSPRFHVLLSTQASYFGRKYVREHDWRQAWKGSLGVDYDPIVIIKPLKTKPSRKEIFTEFAKYETKPSDTGLFDPALNSELKKQFHHIKALVFGGDLKRPNKAFEEDSSVSEDLACFRWSK